MRVTIRRTTDAAAVRRIHQRLMPHDEVDVEDDDFMWLVFQENRAVGFATARRAADCAYIPRMAVSYRCAGRGIQRRLLARMEVDLAARGFDAIVTYVLTWNFKSLANFIRSGYLGYLPEHAWAGEKVIYLQKELEG